MSLSHDKTGDGQDARGGDSQVEETGEHEGSSIGVSPPLEHLNDSIAQSSALRPSAELSVEAVLSPRALLIGECICAQHPTVPGRVLIRYATQAGRTLEQWLQVVKEVIVHERDRVLLSHPANWVEPIVTATLDGSPTSRTGSEGGPTIQLKPHETVRVLGRNQQPLVEVSDAGQGPVIRLLTDGVDLEFKGKLRISAESLELRATEGGAQLTAPEDVVIRGHRIRLN